MDCPLVHPGGYERFMHKFILAPGQGAQGVFFHKRTIQADYGRRGKLGNSGGIELGIPADSGHQGRSFY